ncbi:Uncharacterised protein [Acinetobacter baumannii]|nr:Uncharacterised protein [Acinetobacter baumannii]
MLLQAVHGSVPIGATSPRACRWVSTVFTGVRRSLRSSGVWQLEQCCRYSSRPSATLVGSGAPNSWFGQAGGFSWPSWSSMRIRLSTLMLDG